MMTIAMVLKAIRDDLDWRGPDNSLMPNVKLEREQAEYLHRWAIDMCQAKDDLEYELDVMRRRWGTSG